ncbi:hypothetical protein [Herbaspirillum huttiense]|uniref:hypothetical protein n=1 Tax=Herbaspirillum huttiense TaxID=863372 RepID=UPI0012FF56FE|nr:hypothetical protein [Herbaspirillum huttiense]UWE16020.1 hypothetical protein NY669_23535 [Herbaspirillum huttiense]
MNMQEPDPCAYQYVISLRIWHPDMPHEEISRTMGRTPNRSWTVGSPRFSIHGKPLGGAYDFSYWTERLTKKTVLSDTIWVEEEIARQVEAFSQQALFFRKVRAEGGRAELFVGLFSDFNIVVELEPALMGRLAEASLGICLDYYPYKKDEKQG